MWVNEGTPTMSFVLYTIDAEYLCDASYAPWKYRQYRRYHFKKNIPGARFNSSGTSFFFPCIFLYVNCIRKKLSCKAGEKNLTEIQNSVPINSKTKYHHIMIKSQHIIILNHHIMTINDHADKVSSYNDKESSYNDKVSSYNDKESSYYDKVTSYYDKASSYNDKVSSHIQKSSYNDKVWSYNDRVS